MFDLVIDHATVVDGTGSPARTASVAVRDGRIVRIADRIDDEATERIDGRPASCCARASSTRTPTTTRSSSGIPPRHRRTSTASPRHRRQLRVHPRAPRPR